MKFAGVIVDISHEKLDKTFQYLIPDEYLEQVDIGSLVEIPFGKSIRKGYVVEFSHAPEIAVERIKPIRGIVKNSTAIDENLIRLAAWMRRQYGSTINQSLKTVIPVKEKIKPELHQTVELLIPPEDARRLAIEAKLKNRVAQARLLEALSEDPVTDYSLLIQKLNISRQTVASLAKKEILRLEEITIFRNSMNVTAKKKMNFILNQEQQGVVDGILNEFDAGDMTPCLIKGVTGSGKTEVYMEIISHVIDSGREVLMLIPEIALTYQTVMRFYHRFGDQVSIINSRLSKGEKYDRFLMARSGKIKIMIGPRSALFTPFLNLGLIIIDEEHENAYQSDNVPKYHARETAIELARLNQGKVILGSATPSLDAYYRCQTGEYHLYRIDNRAGEGVLPQVQVVDLREEMKNGNRSVFSMDLMERMEERLRKKEQIILFLNRRGYQAFVNCRDCGHVIQCPHCAVSLTQHAHGRLVCHYCGYQETFTRICPSCHSKHVGTFKAGTEKVEEETRTLFPEAKILRMDLDTTKGKDGHEKILEQFANHDADILIGTQMIVKGHDFPDVTLVGILLADMSLHSSDYAAGEKTFELLTQAAGRAGRGAKAGHVIIQTYDPEHFSIVYASKQDYDGFYEAELAYRDLMEYPPVCHMMSVKISSPNEGQAIALSLKLKEATLGADFLQMRIIGPSNASIYKIKDVFYRMIYYKHSDNESLIQMKDFIEQYVLEHPEEYKDCQIQFDFR